MPNPINDNNKPKTILEELREVRMSFSDVRDAHWWHRMGNHGR